MVARSILLRHLRTHKLPSVRYISTSPPTLKASRSSSSPTSPATPQHQNQNLNQNESPQKKSWLTRQVETSPAARKLFFAFTNALGYGSTTQVAGRRALAMYRDVCAIRPDEDKEFWQNDCFLPPTFQSWFTITNLHVWMLTVRLRALPPDLGKAYQQALIDHFFLDVEDRIRTVLQPPEQPTKPYTFESAFYTNPNAPPAPSTSTSTSAGEEGQQDKEREEKRKRSRAPDRIVTRQMKIFKEQWAGMGLSLDLGLVTSDMELAGAVWRNLLGARGAQGIAYPSASPPPSASASTTPAHAFRRAVNLVGGEVVNVAKIDVDKEEARDDGSGVHDFAPAEADKYLAYPGVMLDVVGYVRRELARLQEVSDEEVVSGDWRALAFRRVRS